jgi:hypothetical protein
MPIPRKIIPIAAPYTHARIVKVFRMYYWGRRTRVWTVQPRGEKNILRAGPIQRMGDETVREMPLRPTKGDEE